MRGETLTITQKTTFHVEECYSCAVPFAFPEHLYETLMAQKANQLFYCPNGHAQSYVGKTDKQKLREAQDALRAAELREQTERDQRLAAEREAKRLEKRAKAGVCPCCHRSFVQLSRHMKTKHPDYGS